MAGGGDYSRNQRIYRQKSGALAITPLMSGTFILAVSALNHSIFLQRVHVVVAQAGAGFTWQLLDGTGIPLTPLWSTTTALPPPLDDVDFGAEGYPLTENATLVLTISGGGAAGSITWEAFLKQTSTQAMGLANPALGPRSHEFTVTADNNPASTNVGFTTPGTLGG